MGETIDAEVTAWAEGFQNMVPPGAESSGLNRSADQVSRDMRTYVEDGRITADGHAEFMWLFHHAKTEKRLTNWDAVGKLIGMSGTTISRLFNGKYTGSLENVLESVQGYHHLTAERQKMSSDVFVETTIWERIRNACDLSLLRNKPVRIIGPTQIGKTTALEEYKRRAKYSVVLFRVPSSPSFRLFQQTLAEACGLNPLLRDFDIRNRLPGALTRQTLLVVDEFHGLAKSAGKSTAIRCAEFLREMWDRSRCGLVLCGTKEMEDDLLNGAGMGGWLKQLDKRCVRIENLPLRLPDEDISRVAAAYGLPKPTVEVAPLLRQLEMNILSAAANMTATWAKKNGEALSWELFRRVYRKNFGGVQ